jgi:uncharacterized protein (TIGR00251 family)
VTRPWCSALPGGVRLAVQITPNAKKTEVIGVLDGALKLKLQAQPVEGKANAALIVYLAKTLGVPRSAVTITHGHTSKKKLIEIISPTLTPDGVQKQLAGTLYDAGPAN